MCMFLVMLLLLPVARNPEDPEELQSDRISEIIADDNNVLDVSVSFMKTLKKQFSKM